MLDRLREHDISLRGPRLLLRPLTEDDWEILLPWNQDPEVLFFADGGDVPSWTLEQIHDIYRGVSQKAFNFIFEFEGRPVGEGWLQEMNLTRLLSSHPGEDLRRIDLLIGEKELWGQGLGTEAIRLLTDFGFREQGCDRIFACGVGDHNPRSRGAFRKCGYQVSLVLPERSPKMRCSYDLSLTRGKHEGRPQRPRVLNMVEAAGTVDDWAPVAALAEVVFAPPDPATLADLLPDFEVCCLPEGLALPVELARQTRRLRLLAQPSNLSQELYQYLYDHGIEFVSEGAQHLIGALRTCLEARQ